MKEIPLSQGKVAIVDDADYDMLMKHKWYASKRTHTWYAQRKVRRDDGTCYLLYMHAALLGAKGVDHISGNGLDNQRVNLRLANKQQNGANMRPRVGGSSAFKGIYWDKKREKWHAMIRFDYKRYHLGRFTDELKAAAAYDAKARELFGEFAYLNFPKAITV